MRFENIQKLCEEIGIMLAPFREGSTFVGLAINDNGLMSIGYNPALEDTERLYVIAHEIGHHVLKHLTEREMDSKSREIEADIFASVFTALSLYTKAAA